MVNDAAQKLEKRDDRSNIRVFEEGLDASYNEYSNDSERDRCSKESERLVKIAKKHNLFIPIEETKFLGYKHPKRTGESVVYVNEDTNRVFKVKNPYAKFSIKKGVQPEDVIFEHIVHNLLFPEAIYKFEGISEEIDGVRIILSQEFIQSKGQPTKKQIINALKEKGLVIENNYFFGNDYVSITDIEGDNALLDSNGNIRFIDPIICFKKPLKEILLKYYMY